MALLEIENLCKNFGGLLAVDNLNLQVNRGEIVSLIGPNGAGKTTVFNLITGVYKVSSGYITFDKTNIQNKDAHIIVKQGISRTFQNIRLFKNLRTIENVLVGSHVLTSYSNFDQLTRNRKYREEERQVTQNAIDILLRIGFDSASIHEYAGNLPYGQQRKLEIARAMASGAKLLLLDEPAAGMNPQETIELMKFIKGLLRDGFTVLLIEHDMNVVMNISDRIYVLNHGSLIAKGTPSEVSSNSVVIDAYLGSEE